MNCFSTFSRAIFTRNCFSVLVPKGKTSFINYGFSFSIIKQQPIVLDSFPSKFHVHCFSSRTRKKLPNPTSPSVKLLDIEPPPSIEPEKDDFFVVRKGDIVGVYKNFTDCLAQFGSSVCDPPVSVFKGHSLSKDTEEYLASVGLKNAMYTIKAADLRPDLFTSLMPCTFHDELKCEASGPDATKKRSLGALVPENVQGSVVSTSSSMDPLRKHVKLEDPTMPLALSPQSCYLEFDGASKGNPGKAGAGAVLRAHDGSVVCRLREGLGTATNNVAEYRAILLGLKYALQKGYTGIHVQGDSKLVCLQVQGSWKARNENMSQLCKQVKKLKNQFLSFHISHVLRNLNSEADAQANLGVSLAAGQVQEVFE